jgi:hypothetical protein
LLLFVLCIGAASAGTTQFLSKVTRADPALMQYAAQAFGTINLSEEDWKKAEDHYKVMFCFISFVLPCARSVQLAVHSNPPFCFVQLMTVICCAVLVLAFFIKEPASLVKNT